MPAKKLNSQLVNQMKLAIALGCIGILAIIGTCPLGLFNARLCRNEKLPGLNKSLLNTTHYNPRTNGTYTYTMDDLVKSCAVQWTIIELSPIVVFLSLCFLVNIFC